MQAFPEARPLCGPPPALYGKRMPTTHNFLREFYFHTGLCLEPYMDVILSMKSLKPNSESLKPTGDDSIAVEGLSVEQEP